MLVATVVTLALPFAPHDVREVLSGDDVLVNAVAQACRPTRRRVSPMQRQIDQLGYSIRVEPDRGSAVQLVLECADRIAKHPRHFIHLKAVMDTPGI